MSEKKKVLFVCVENSCRSQLAEALTNLHGGKAVEAHSAGSRPSGVVNPKAVASMAELGYPDLDIAPIVGVVAPRNTPGDIITKLSAEVQRAVRDPAVSGKLTGLGLEVIADTPEQFAAFLEAEGRQWLPVIRKLDIKLD